MPKLSIIIPHYNTPQYLRELLESISFQSFQDLEIIFVDDNSVLKSLQYLEREILSVHNKSIQLVKNLENRGAAESRNIGLSKATGTYVTFLDADDALCGRYSLHSRIEFLEQHPSYSGVTGYSVQIDDQGKIIYNQNSSSSIILEAMHNPDHLLEYYCKNVLNVSSNTARILFSVAGSSMFRFDDIQALPFDKEFEGEEDVEWSLRFLEKKLMRIQMIPYFLRRIHNQQYHLATSTHVTERVRQLAWNIYKTKQDALH